MKWLKEQEIEEYSLEVVECDCGFHMGFDATFIDQVSDFKIDCPACGVVIDTEVIFPEWRARNL